MIARKMKNLFLSNINTIGLFFTCISKEGFTSSHFRLIGPISRLFGSSARAVRCWDSNTSTLKVKSANANRCLMETRESGMFIK